MTSPDDRPSAVSAMVVSWQRRWLDLETSDPGLGAELAARYGEPSRSYHGLDHLRAVLAAIDVLAPLATDARAVRLAAWFHDAVYDVHRDDNEEQSAALARSRLPDAGVDAVTIEEVARLVRLTRSHDPGPADADGRVLCDADLSVLAGSTQAYEAYTRAVRREYAYVAEADFRRGRAAVLAQLLALPTVYGTAYGQQHWEGIARTNLETELSRLRRANR